MKITEAQAQLLIDWMAMAATDAAEDQHEGESWRIHRFQHQAKVFLTQFNEAEPEPIGILEKMVAECEVDGERYSPSAQTILEARAAIAKAKGQP